MAKKQNPLGAFPSRSPIDVNNDLWFYENSGSITVVVGNSARQVKLPMKKLCQTVDRYRAYRKRRNK